MFPDGATHGLKHEGRCPCMERAVSLAKRNWWQFRRVRKPLKTLREATATGGGEVLTRIADEGIWLCLETKNGCIPHRSPVASWDGMGQSVEEALRVHLIKAKHLILSLRVQGCLAKACWKLSSAFEWPLQVTGRPLLTSFHLQAGSAGVSQIEDEYFFCLYELGSHPPPSQKGRVPSTAREDYLTSWQRFLRETTNLRVSSFKMKHQLDPDIAWQHRLADYLFVSVTRHLAQDRLPGALECLSLRPRPTGVVASQWGGAEPALAGDAGRPSPTMDRAENLPPPIGHLYCLGVWLSFYDRT